MKLFAIPALALALTSTTLAAQTVQDAIKDTTVRVSAIDGPIYFTSEGNRDNVIKDTTVSVTAIAGPLDFTLEGNRDNVTEIEVGLTTFDHSYDGVDAAVRFAFGADLRGSDTLYGRIEYNFSSEVADSLAVYGSAAVQYNTNTKLESGLWTFDPSLGVSYGVTTNVAVFAEVGYTWELNQTKRDLGGYVKVGVPFAVTDSLYVIPSVSRTFRSDENITAAHLNLTYQF